MKNTKYFLNTVLTILVSIGLASAILVRTFAPIVILPKMSIPALVLISVIALVIDHYMAPKAERCYICVSIFSALSFGVLPFIAGFITPVGAMIYFFGGAAVFTVSTWLFSLVVDRLSSGPAAKLAPLLSGAGLYLACQCFMNIIL
jgi:hypothetical protein